MKKIFSALFFTLFGAAALMTSCSDVPAPYEIKSPDDVDLVGTGTKEDPYNVATAQMKQDGSVAWVQGYIVGVMETNVDPFTANFAAPFSTSSNLMIADTPDEQKAKNCVIVQLPFGAIRTALNLVDHADNLKQPVILQGTLTSYFSAAGLKEVSAGVFKGEEIGEEEGGEGETPEGNLIFEEKFTANEGDFTIKNVTLPEGSSYVWKWEQYQTNPPYMKASAYVGGSNKASESWLISPAINLSDATKATLVFKHAHKFGVDKTKELTLWATEAGKEAWEQLTIPNYGSGESWTMVSSGNIDLSKYAGKEVQVGFKYVSTTEGAPTWEVNDVQVYSDGSGNVPTPEEEVTVTKDAPYVESFELGLGKFIIDNKEIGSLSFVWKHDASYKYMKASAYVNGTNNVTESWLTSPVINLTGVDKAVLTFDQAINFAKGKASQYLTVVATEAGMNNWEPLTITYPESDSWNFVASGDVDLNKYAGKKVQLAFKYTSSSEIAATWEVKNVKVAATENGGGTEPEPGTADLFISEYVEGSSFNKYIEIYNPTDQTIDLAGYTLGMHNYSGSGEGGNDSGIKSVALSGTLAPKQVVIYKHSKATAYLGEAIAIDDNVMNFNGNDPVILYKGTDNVIDYFGVDNTAFGADKTFRRKSSVTGPSATYNADEWEATSKDDVSGLGSHTMN
ncbi:DUF6359 domain-containing protein [Phocaeicola sp. KGMB11183]|uniref:DUF6359 domain-containing protein n=1 Tax=Phocaeicola acetigenes TaxID=3016083 RepID=A0ABT4PDI2_9BACT|nr:DUF6359 domain-containing protein [Phocaeicola sp. KGMB11183]MCZ8371109.1 DUF6359 domain-containing protein [Phocaeicola sp. KGMB11183]